MPKKKKRKKVKKRNHLAVIAKIRTGAGTHPDQKKEANKKKCRGKVNPEQE